MKLKARFPQILVVGRGSAGAGETVQHSALRPAARNPADTLGDAPGHPRGTPRGPWPPAARARAARAGGGWLSTVAAWRSTTGLSHGGRT